MAQKPLLAGRTMDKAAIRVSLRGRMDSPVSIERLASIIDAPRNLVSEVVRALARAKSPTVIVVGTKMEDGELRVMFQSKEKAHGAGAR